MTSKPLGIRQPKLYQRSAVNGTGDNSRTLEEPCEINVSSTVLVRRESRAFSANGAFDWEAVFPGGAFLPVPT